jgi:hypothetical protein
VELTQKLLIITEGMQLLKREIKLPGRLKWFDAFKKSLVIDILFA